MYALKEQNTNSLESLHARTLEIFNDYMLEDQIAKTHKASRVINGFMVVSIAPASHDYSGNRYFKQVSNVGRTCGCKQ